MDELVRAAEEDPDTLAGILHGSRAAGHEHGGSDWDVVYVRTRAEKPPLPPGVDAAVTTLDELNTLEPYWFTDGIVQGCVLLDKTGELPAILERLSRAAPDAAYEAYDAYLNAFVRGMSAARRSDELAMRLHAADSARYLVQALFAVEGARPPFHDRLTGKLPEWEEDLLAVLRDPDPARQRALYARVEALMEAHGLFTHREWGDNVVTAARGV